MHIQEVIEVAVLGIFAESKLSSILVLKGGAALHLLEHIDERLSTDIDMSSKKLIDNPEDFFKYVEKALRKAFNHYKYDILDFKFYKKPKKSTKKPKWWRGWLCHFKLSPHEDRKFSLEKRIRGALVPEKASSSKTEIEISEYEYCGKIKYKSVRGVRIAGYSRALLVVEKIRAICQQHPSYIHSTTRNRTRDLLDIYNLTFNRLEDHFFEECKKILPKSFDAKKVDLKLLDSFWEESFVEILKEGFPQVLDTLKGRPYPFDTYLENVRYIINKVR